MMRKECVQAVAKALGRDLKGTETVDIENRLKKAARFIATKDPQAWMAKSSDAKMSESAQQAALELVGEAKLKADREAKSIAAWGRLSTVLADGRAAGLSDLDIVDRINAFNADGKLNFQSVERRAIAIRSDFMRELIPVMEASNPKWFGLLENEAGVQAITKAIFGEPTGIKEADDGAKIWKRVAEAGRKRFNALGGDIGALDDWGMPHHHSQIQVSRAGRDAWLAQLDPKARAKAKLFNTAPPKDWARDAWVNDILPRLNRAKYLKEDGTAMNDSEMTEFLREAWLSIATGGANKMQPGQFKSSGMRANRGNHERAIHFKDAQNFIDYQKKFGEKSLYEILTGHVEGMAKDIALTETYGPNPDFMYRLFRDYAVKRAKESEPARANEIDAQAIKSDNLYNFISGKTLPVVNERIAKTFDTLRGWLTSSRLGGAVISSITDEGTLHLTARINDLPELQLIRNELAALNPANKMEERMAMRAGLALNTFISSLNRFGQDSLGSTFAQKLGTTVLRASGLNAITEARRRAFGITAMGSVGAVTRDHAKLGDIDLDDARILKNKGVTDEDFNVWKQAQLEDWGSGNDTMLTPESIYRTTDAQIDKAIGPRIQKIRDDAQKSIDKLNDRNAQDQTWAADRTTKLRDWVKDQQGKVAEAAKKADEKTKERLQGLAKRLGALYGQIDTVGSYFKETKKNQVSLADLRRAGVSEGRNQAATDKVADSLRKAMRDTATFKDDLDTEFRERFVAREQEINQLIENGADEQRVALALDKFDELFDQANARLTTRLDKADERLTKKLTASVDRVKEIRGRIAEADQVWQKANDARPEFSRLRAQGVTEGRAREASTNLKRQVLDITRELAAAKKEKALDFAERWADRKADLDEFTARSDKRIQRRQQVVDRLQNDVQPSIERARVDAREQAATRLLGLVLEETDMAVIEPGAKERAMMGAGLQRGTWKGEIARSFFLFKSFPISMLTRHWTRGMSQPNNGGRAKYLATLIATTTVLGAVAMQVKELLAGRDPRNLNPFAQHGLKNWMKAMLQGGSLGLYGDFLFSEASQHGQSPVASFLGPVVGLAEDVFKFTQGNLVQAAQGKDTDVGAEAVKLVRGNLPGGNLWYSKAALDHLIWNQLAEMYSPGYLGRVRRRAQREFGQSYYWDPQDVLPERAPDAGAAFQTE